MMNTQSILNVAKRLMDVPEDGDGHPVDYILGEVCDMFYGKEHENLARQIFVKARWPDGVTCPRCGDSAFWMERYGKFHCTDDRCKYQFSPKAQTRFHKSRLPFSQIVGGALLFDYYGGRYGCMTDILIANQDDGPDAKIWNNWLATYPMSWPTAHRLFILISWDEWDRWWLVNGATNE